MGHLGPAGVEGRVVDCQGISSLEILVANVTMITEDALEVHRLHVVSDKAPP